MHDNATEHTSNPILEELITTRTFSVEQKTISLVLGKLDLKIILFYFFL